MRGKLVALEHAKGGVGRTMTAANLAVMALAEGLDPLVVDLDPQASITRWGQVRADSGAVPVEVVAANTASLGRLVAKASKRLVIVDTPPHHSGISRSVAELADLIVVPTHQDAVDLEVIPDTARLIRECKTKGLLFINDLGTTQRVSDDVYAACADMGLPVQALVRTRVAYRDAYTMGMGVAEWGTRGQVAKLEFEAVWDCIKLAMGSK